MSGLAPNYHRIPHAAAAVSTAESRVGAQPVATKCSDAIASGGGGVPAIHVMI